MRIIYADAPANSDAVGEVTTMTVTVLALSVLLQFAAAIMAVRLMRLTGERVAWGFMATSGT